MSDDLASLSATTIADEVRTGERSAEAVLEACLSRVDARNGDLTAFVTVIEEDARERARAADRAAARGEDLGPLHGVPVGLKDLFGWKAGVRNTFGSKLFESYHPDEDAIITERLEAAGAVVVGKTNTPEFALGPTTDNRVFGRTSNPFDPERTSGGSSGGSAAAVAAGMVPIAQGSDAGGSVRIPAAFCGAVGIKPTFGRIPMVRPLRPNVFVRSTPYFQFGPIARTVADAAVMLDVMAGPHPADPFTLPAPDPPFQAAVDRGVETLDIAYSRGLGTFPIDPAVREQTDAAADALAAVAGSLDVTDPPMTVTQDDVLAGFYDWARVAWRELLRNLGEAHDLDPFGADRDRLRPVLVETVMAGAGPSADEYAHRGVLRSAVYDAMTTLFQDYDLLIMPTLAVPAFRHDDPPTSIDGVSIEPLRGWVLTQLFNMTGHPAASVPAGFTDEGLPVGLQVVGPRMRDHDVIAACGTLERERPWASRYPG